MLPWVRHGAVQTEDGVELRLMQRGSEFCIMLGNNPLMNSVAMPNMLRTAWLAMTRAASLRTVEAKSRQPTFPVVTNWVTASSIARDADWKTICALLAELAASSA